MDKEYIERERAFNANLELFKNGVRDALEGTACYMDDDYLDDDYHYKQGYDFGITLRKNLEVKNNV